VAKVIYAPENDSPGNFERGLPRIDVLAHRVLAMHRDMTPRGDKPVLPERQTMRQIKIRSEKASRWLNRQGLERLAAERDAYGTPTWRAVAAAAVLETGLPISWSDIVGPSRKRHIVHARGMAICSVRRQKPHLSLCKIGKLFGGRDRTTVLNSLQKHGAVQP
jgi:hypothetical protein